jgi:hypothetical protein
MKWLARPDQDLNTRSTADYEPNSNSIDPNNNYSPSMLTVSVRVNLIPAEGRSESAHIPVRELLSRIGHHFGGRCVLPLDEVPNEKIPVVAVIGLDLLADTTDFLNDRLFHTPSVNSLTRQLSGPADDLSRQAVIHGYSEHQGGHARHDRTCRLVDIAVDRRAGRRYRYGDEKAALEVPQ